MDKSEFFFDMTLYMEPTASPDWFQHYIHYRKPSDWGNDTWNFHEIQIEMKWITLHWTVWTMEEHTDLEICRMVAPYLFMEPVHIIDLNFPRLEDEELGYGNE